MQIFHSSNPRTHLHTTDPEMWIGHGGPIAWPAHSTVLDPLDFFWRHLKLLVYETRRAAVKDPTELIIVASTLDFFERLRHSFVRWCRLCYDLSGRNYEQLLR
ncbi:uncharacterized protein TNCV_4162051 [Trichonephila clavipes]|nr:uncharacterized protein TNCV_4162051 [Trichonephila clavipes]